MRILHVTDCYLPRLGGIEMHVSDLARNQHAMGHDARVLTAAHADPGEDADPPWVQRVRVEAPTSILRSALAAARLRQAIQDAGIDVVHAHISVLSPFASAAAGQAALLGMPTVITVHSLWSRFGPLAPMASMTLGLRSWPVLWSAVSDRAADPLRRMLGPESAVVVLPNAVDPSAWHIEPVAPIVPTVVSVMRLAHLKRPLPLARMLRRVRAAVPDSRPLRAVLIGEGPQRNALERYLERHRMRGWVELTGRLDRPAIRGIFAESSLYVAPAPIESFGIAALEARCAGLPVVASSHGGVGEFITHGVDGLLAPSDDAMVAAIVRLLTDARTRCAITAHNRSVVPDLTWHTACEKSFEAYAEASRIARTDRAYGPSRPRPVSMPGSGP